MDVSSSGVTMFCFRCPKAMMKIVMCERIIPETAPFQLAIGTSIANRKTPRRGPDVTLVINMDL
jgi:hypothetical protein